MHDMVQASNYNSTILESSGMYEEVEALQRLLMVMSGPRDSGKPPEPHQIWFLTHNLSIYMVAVNIDSRVKNVWYSECDILNFHDFTSNRIQESITVHSSSCKSLTSKSGWECPSLMKSWNFEVGHLKD